MTTVRTRTRRAPAVQPVSTPSITIDLLDQPACHHRTDFDELERRLYMSSNPAHWAQAATLDGIRQRTEYRIEAETEEQHGDIGHRNEERLALRDLVRKLVAQLKKPLEVTMSLDADGEANVVRVDQDALDELIESADEVISDYDVDTLEDSEKPKQPEKTV